MKLVETIEVVSGSADIHRIELLLGDLTKIPDKHRVDVLVVSAFSRDYQETEDSLIGGLARKGLSVSQLVDSPEVDLRENFSCWISRKIARPIPGLSFRRVLCFEPAARGEPPELVGDIFRALAPFAYAKPAVRSIALPILAAGDQGYSISAMLPPILDAATHWLAIGFPLSTIKLVVRSKDSLSEALPIFRKYMKRRMRVALAHQKRLMKLAPSSELLDCTNMMYLSATRERITMRRVILPSVLSDMILARSSIATKSTWAPLGSRRFSMLLRAA